MYDLDPVPDAACLIQFDEQGAPFIARQTGQFLAVARTGMAPAGDLTLTMQPGHGVATADTYPTTQVFGVVLAASENMTIAIDQTNAENFRITSLQEGAAGAVSALTDIPFIFKLDKKRH